jgi:hypothetical protein
MDQLYHEQHFQLPRRWNPPHHHAYQLRMSRLQIVYPNTLPKQPSSSKRSSSPPPSATLVTGATPRLTSPSKKARLVANENLASSSSSKLDFKGKAKSVDFDEMMQTVDSDDEFEDLGKPHSSLSPSPSATLGRQETPDFDVEEVKTQVKGKGKKKQRAARN